MVYSLHLTIFERYWLLHYFLWLQNLIEQYSFVIHVGIVVPIVEQIKRIYIKTHATHQFANRVLVHIITQHAHYAEQNYHQVNILSIDVPNVRKNAKNVLNVALHSSKQKEY